MLLHLIYFANLKTLCYFTKQILPIIATKKAATIEEAGEVLLTEKVEPGGVEPPSKQGQSEVSTCLSRD